jgi:polyphosphate glucokinase
VVHALHAARGVGVELLLTLGTGLGSALVVDGRPVPLELGHLPWRGGRSIERCVGEAARKRLGDARWRREVDRVLAAMTAAFAPDALLVGGGNAARLHRRAGTRVVGNDAGLLGGPRLWGKGAPAGRGSRA